MKSKIGLKWVRLGRRLRTPLSLKGGKPSTQIKKQKQVSREDLNAYQTLEKYFQQITHNDFIQEGKK